MVSRWTRIGYSAISFGAGIAFYGLFAVLWSASSMQGSLVGAFLWLCFPALVFALPGWLIALPLILGVARIDGWRFWALLGLGTTIGPAVILAFEACSWLAGGMVGTLNNFGLGLLALGAVVAAVTSLVYLLLLQRGQRSLAD